MRTGISVEAVTDANGNYEFVNQRLGSYKIRVAQTGFQTTETEPFDLAVNARQRVDLTLQVGQATESVTVEGAASLMETDTSSRGQVINPREIVEMPLNGRAYADLMLLAPGVAKSPLENGTDSSRDASFNVNGGRSELNNFMLDGVDNNAYGTSNQGFSNQVIQPNPDALQQFKVETNNYSAEFGRASGRGGERHHQERRQSVSRRVVGVPAQHQTECGRFLQAVGRGTLPFNQNQFGAAFGGPMQERQDVLLRGLRGLSAAYTIRCNSPPFRPLRWTRAISAPMACRSRIRSPAPHTPTA